MLETKSRYGATNVAGFLPEWQGQCEGYHSYSKCTDLFNNDSLSGIELYYWKYQYTGTNTSNHSNNNI